MTHSRVDENLQVLNRIDTIRLHRMTVPPFSGRSSPISSFMANEEAFDLLLAM
jgi:hypothetical protein